MKYTLILVGEFASLNQADDVADGISQDADLAILVVRPSSVEEIQGFNQDYLRAMTEARRPDLPPAA
jgi:hypothetical protein